MASSMSSINRPERAPDLLGGKVSSSLTALLCSECALPITDSRQASCGCRLCGNCFSLLLESDSDVFVCKKCGYYFSINETFKDRAVESELKRTSFPCYNKQCPWLGSNSKYREHISSCKYGWVVCPNPVCGFQAIRNDIEAHISSCPFTQSPCQYCHTVLSISKLKEHVTNSCPEYMILCSAGCGEKMLRKELGEHLANYCKLQKRPCRYTKYGCHQKNTLDALLTHYSTDAGYHLGLIEKELREGAILEPPQSRHIEEVGTTRAELIRYKEEIDHRVSPITDGLLKAEVKLSELQDSFQELSLLVQTLQATSYSGQFIWKIPDVSRRRLEAKSGKTVSLYSAPFYTSRFGYKLCLRLYLDGDGSGKGTHISFFLTIMKGEYDALLSWPFAQMVTLLLMDQSETKNIMQCFKPEPTSSSFWQPQSEMNVASGCPKFAPLSVLNDPSYVKDDSMFFKVMIDTSTLTQP